MSAALPIFILKCKILRGAGDHLLTFGPGSFMALAMQNKTLSIACDHAGFGLKQEVVQFLQQSGFEVLDHGCPTEERVDYPDYAAQVAHDIESGQSERGILICGTGIGMALTANKIKGVRAASLDDVYSTRMARAHNDLNILCLGSRVVGLGLALLLVETFLQTKFEGGRHAERVKKMMAFEN